MLVLGFSAAGAHLAIPLERVERIYPPARLTPIPRAPRGLMGLLFDRGEPIPVIGVEDILGESCRDAPAMGERFIRCNAGSRGALCLFVEEVQGVMEVTEEELMEPPARPQGTQFAGMLFRRGDNLFQMIHVEELLTEEVRSALAEAPC